MHDHTGDDHHHDHEHTDGHDHSEHEHGTSHEEQHLIAFRKAKDDFLRSHPQSPLAEEARPSFTGLQYYPFNADLHLQLPLDLEGVEGSVTMDTSTGESREYHRAGRVHFDVGDQAATLTVYRGPNNELFLPIRDATSGAETYGAGRYLEPEMVNDDRIDIDFNYLYNPYCAYNEAYSCPLPPMENWLRVPIAAGEKKLHD